MSLDNGQPPRRPDSKGSSVVPTFLWYLFLIVTFVLLIAIVFAKMSVMTIPYADLEALTRNSMRDEQGNLVAGMSGELMRRG
jgi:hypothetical protein